MARRIQLGGGGSTGTAVLPCAFAFTYTSVPLASSTWPATGLVATSNVYPTFLNGYYQAGSGAAPCDLNFKAPLRAGIYTVIVRYTTGPNLGLFTVLVDGVESAGIDTYSASYAIASTALSFTVVAPGDHAVTIRKKGTKNAAASDYYILWSAIDGAIV